MLVSHMYPAHNTTPCKKRKKDLAQKSVIYSDKAAFIKFNLHLSRRTIAV